MVACVEEAASADDSDEKAADDADKDKEAANEEAKHCSLLVGVVGSRKEFARVLHSHGGFQPASRLAVAVAVETTA